jgi:hypothetical protein
MDKDKQREILTNRIITATIYLKVKESVYRLSPPTREDIALADFVYDEVFNSDKYDGMLTREQAFLYLKKEGVWSEEDDKKIEDTNKLIEDIKVEMYKSLYNLAQLNALRAKLRSTEKYLSFLYSVKYKLDELTLEYHAEKTKSDFLTAMCIFDLNNKKVYNYDTYWANDSFIFKYFVNWKERNAIPSKTYRDIVKNEPYKGMWSLKKIDIFNAPSGILNDDQKRCAMYSRMYDNVYESLDVPSDEVIDDDDILDGWLISKHRERTKDRKQKEVDQLLNKKGVNKVSRGAGNEVFVLAQTRQEANKILEVNDNNAKAAIQQRVSKIQQSGQVEDQNLPDVQMYLQNKARQQQLEHRKRGR